MNTLPKKQRLVVESTIYAREIEILLARSERPSEFRRGILEYLGRSAHHGVPATFPGHPQLTDLLSIPFHPPGIDYSIRVIYRARDEQVICVSVWRIPSPADQD